MAHKNTFSVLLAVILAVSLATYCFSFTQAQSMPKPSVPEFAVTIVNANGTANIQITILNQAIGSLETGKTYHIYYNLRIKDHSGEDWTELYPLQYGASSQDNAYEKSPYVHAFLQSGSDKTIMSIPNAAYPYDTQLDIQVQAIIGHDSQVWVSDHPTQPQISGYYEAAVAFNNSSDWSSTQTVSISGVSAPVEFIVYFVLVTVIALLVITVLICRRIRTSEKKQNGA